MTDEELKTLSEIISDAEWQKLRAIRGGKTSRRKITPEQQIKMQAARKKKE